MDGMTISNSNALLAGENGGEKVFPECASFASLILLG